MKLFKVALETVIIVIGIVLFLKFFVLGFFYVSSDSMYPKLLEGDYIIVSKVSYDIFGFEYNQPSLGDIVVINKDGYKITKRLVGLPGDSIVYDSKNVFINGLGLVFNQYQKYSDFIENVPNNMITHHFLNEEKEEYFFIGDFLELSRDSRNFGAIDKDKIVGKAIVVYLSKDSNNKIRTQRIGNLLK